MTNTVLDKNMIDMKESSDEITLIDDELLNKLFDLANEAQ